MTKRDAESALSDVDDMIYVCVGALKRYRKRLKTLKVLRALAAKEAK